MTNEQRVLDESGYYDEKFTRTTIEVLRHITIEDLSTIHKTVHNLKRSGADPIKILRSTLN